VRSSRDSDEREEYVHFLHFLIVAIGVIASLFAALFWIVSAVGKTLEWPWNSPKAVPADKLATHQAKWNANAAVCAGVAAIIQAVLFLHEYYWPR
jgi:hypothetical protein